MSHRLDVDEGAAVALAELDPVSTLRTIASRPAIVRQLLELGDYEPWHEYLTEILAAQTALEANGGGWLTVEDAGHTVTVWIGTPEAS